MTSGSNVGAVGKYGSIAVVESLIRTMKIAGTRRLLVSYGWFELLGEISLFFEWYKRYGPHNALVARTPDEIYFALPPACLAQRFEPRRGKTQEG